MWMICSRVSGSHSIIPGKSRTHDGAVSVFLGIEFSRTKDSVVWRQTQSIDDLAVEYNLVGCRKIGTPAEQIRLSANEEEENDIGFKRRYQSLVGSLLYIAICTRPDIYHSVLACARYNANPNEVHWTAALRVLRYLVSTRNLGLRFEKGDNRISAFTDSDWAGDLDTRNSTTGGGSVVCWGSKLQRTVAQSSAEAEYYAIAAAINEISYFKKLAQELGFMCESVPVKRVDVSDSLSISLFSDSQGGLAKLKSNRPRTKHLDVKHCLIVQQVEKGLVKLEIDTKENLADIFTKPRSQK